MHEHRRDPRRQATADPDRQRRRGTRRSSTTSRSLTRYDASSEPSPVDVERANRPAEALAQRSRVAQQRNIAAAPPSGRRAAARRGSSSPATPRGDARLSQWSAHGSAAAASIAASRSARPGRSRPAAGSSSSSSAGRATSARASRARARSPCEHTATDRSAIVGQAELIDQLDVPGRGRRSPTGPSCWTVCVTPVSMYAADRQLPPACAAARRRCRSTGAARAGRPGPGCGRGPPPCRGRETAARRPARAASTCRRRSGPSSAQCSPGSTVSDTSRSTCGPPANHRSTPEMSRTLTQWHASGMAPPDAAEQAQLEQRRRRPPRRPRPATRRAAARPTVAASTTPR